MRHLDTEGLSEALLIFKGRVCLGSTSFERQSQPDLLDRGGPVRKRRNAVKKIKTFMLISVK